MSDPWRNIAARQPTCSITLRAAGIEPATPRFGNQQLPIAPQSRRREGKHRTPVAAHTVITVVPSSPQRSAGCISDRWRDTGSRFRAAALNAPEGEGDRQQPQLGPNLSHGAHPCTGPHSRTSAGDHSSDGMMKVFESWCCAAWLSTGGSLVQRVGMLRDSEACFSAAWLSPVGGLVQRSGMLQNTECFVQPSLVQWSWDWFGAATGSNCTWVHCCGLLRSEFQGGRFIPGSLLVATLLVS